MHGILFWLRYTVYLRNWIVYFTVAQDAIFIEHTEHAKLFASVQQEFCV